MMAIAARARTGTNVAAGRTRWHAGSTLTAFGWMTVAQASAGGGLFVASLMRARYLTIEQFALYALIATIATVMTVIADFGLSVIAVRDLSRAATDARTYVAHAIAHSALLSVAAAIGLFGIAMMFSRSNVALELSAVLALGVLLTGLSVTPMAFLRASGRTRFE